jgi:hypothetical protein
MQRAPLLVVSAVYVRAAFDQETTDLGLSFAGCEMQRKFFLSGLGMDIRIMREQ